MLFVAEDGELNRRVETKRGRERENEREKESRESNMDRYKYVQLMWKVIRHHHEQRHVSGTLKSCVVRKIFEARREKRTLKENRASGLEYL